MSSVFSGRDVSLLALLHLALLVLVYEAALSQRRWRWLSVTADVRRSEVTVLTLQKSRRYRVVKSAYYQVDGQDYEFKDGFDAGLVNGWPAGKPAQARQDALEQAQRQLGTEQALRYDPANPGRAVTDIGRASPINRALVVYLLMVCLPALVTYLPALLLHLSTNPTQRGR